MSKKTHLEDEFARQLDLLKIPYKREVKPYEIIVGLGAGIRSRLAERNLKNYRYDFYIESMDLFIEVQGGIWLSSKGKKSAHSTGTGQERDMDKALMAFRFGWNVLHINGKQIKNGAIAILLDEVIKNGFNKRE